MNGLANAILTLLLSWLRVIINRFWSLVNSETGTSFYTFLSQHWLTILLVLLVGGFLVDRLIYLIRWQPFRVWFGRKWKSTDTQETYDPYPAQAYQQQPPVADPAYLQPAPPAEPGYAQPAPAAEPHWQPEATNLYPSASPRPAETTVYAPPVVDRSAFMPPMDHVEPVFDEDTTSWADSDALVTAPSPTRTQPPVTDRYMQDVQAGFARPIPPEQLYAAPVQEAQQPLPQEPWQPDTYAAPQEAQPVHPGLDTDVLRRNMGLSRNDETPMDMQWYDDEPVYGDSVPMAGFTPFTQKAGTEETQKKNRNPFLNLMRLVGDEAAKPSIKDLQSHVDVRTAFHDPVFPQQSYEEEP